MVTSGVRAWGGDPGELPPRNLNPPTSPPLARLVVGPGGEGLCQRLDLRHAKGRLFLSHPTLPPEGRAPGTGKTGVQPGAQPLCPNSPARSGLGPNQALLPGRWVSWYATPKGLPGH